MGHRRAYSAWQMLEERVFDDQAQPVESHAYVWSPRYVDSPILRDWYDDEGTVDPGERLYYLSDANFNVTALVGLVGSNWEVVERYVYDPYGKATVYDAEWSANPQSPIPNPFRYCGYFFDAETSLYNVRWRIYHPTLSTWLTRDPLVADVNVYRYCRNAPTLYVDPAGLEEFDLVDFDSPLLSSFEKDLLQRPAVRKWISQTNNGYLDVLVPEFWHSPPGGRSDLAAYLQQTYLFGWFKWLIGAGRPLRLVTVSRAFDQSTYFQGEVRAQRDLVREKVLDAVRQKMATADSGWIELPPIDASPVLEPQLYGEGQLGFALAGAHKLTIHHEVKVCYNKNARGLTNYHFFINSVYGWHDQIDWRGFTEWEKPQFSTWGGTIWVGIESGLLDIPFDKVMAMSYYVLIVYPKLDMGCGVVEIPGSISCDGA